MVGDKMRSKCFNKLISKLTISGILITSLIGIAVPNNVQAIEITNKTIEYFNDSVSTEMHNRTNNSANGGMVVDQGDWIYYLEKVNGKSLNSNFFSIFKENKDGTNKQQLINKIVRNFTISGEWIYFSTYADDKGIYRIRTDGSKLQKICDDSTLSLIVVDDWVYYIDFDVKTYKEEKIIRIKIDGSQKNNICDDAASNMNIQNGKIYYSNASDNNKLYSISIDGKERKKISDDISSCINISDDWIYYINDKVKGNIYKIKSDGSNKTLVNNELCRCLNVFKDRIYYVTVNPQDTNALWNLYGVDIDGSNITKYTEGYFNNINVINGFIYYQSFFMGDGRQSIERMKDNKNLNQ